MQFDYIIVGAGSAGCVLANRLSENPNNRVCLLEAGPADNSLFIRIPAGIIMMMRSNARNWRYYTVPQKALNNRQIYIPRGKTLGGSSAVNAMCYTRGHKWDYDHWAELGNKGWGYDDVLPVFKRSEHYEAGESTYHGTGGKLNIADLRFTHPVSRAFVKAGVQAGHPATDDFNNEVQEGMGMYKVNQKDGERCGVAKAYLHPVMDRPNLTIMTNALVNRILFDGKRAIGVEVEHDGQIRTLKADNEVVLSGGAINSPQVLKLSGVGPAAELAEHNIPLVHDLPGVGENLQDHPDALVVHKSLRKDTLSLAPGALMTTGLKGIFNFFYRRTGQLTSNVAEAGGFIKSRPEENIPDLQLHLTAAKLDNHGLNMLFSMGYGYSGHVCILRPKSRGNITLRDGNPRSPALIDPRFLEHPDDMEGMVRGVKTIRKIMAQQALTDWRGEEIFPGKEVQSDEEIRGFLRQKCDNIYHPVGTCKMGSDEMAVVDSELRVHGLEGLRVVDASIMPTLIGGNTNAPTVMIAEKAADAILGQ
ncbi:alcohol/choline dehydrogenase [Alcanivorax sp. NBRC 101098]|jgi:choline dehydrogenase-like flavoprotein|uniref:GMC family oxidoreductase n=1 Tax=Alcanivorax TaxID=59753 RepID=UPI0004ABEE87|nr:choline dehydrogenase [Alcanivorax sp. NBRC 101098]BAP13798.1 alcohol/choline dehydrogenase [Alcanivorax sp. NBRC 101098]